MTKPQSKLMTSGKLKTHMKLAPNATAKPCKLVLYVPTSQLATIMEAIAHAPAHAEGPISGGNHQGLAVAAICDQWMKGRAK